MILAADGQARMGSVVVEGVRYKGRTGANQKGTLPRQTTQSLPRSQ